MKRRNTTQAGQYQPTQRPMQRQMGPPPPNTHINSDFEPGNLGLASSSEMAHMFLPSPGLHQRATYSAEIQELGSYFPDGQPPSMRPTASETSPNVNSQSDPWDPIHGQMAPTIMTHNRTAHQGRIFQNGTVSAPYWRSPRSEIDSSITSRDQRDSGYGTQTLGGASVMSYEHPVSNHDAQSMTGRMEETTIPQEPQFKFLFPELSPDTQYSFPLQHAPQQPSQPPPQQIDAPLETMRCQEPDCTHEAKNPSDFK